MNLHGLTQAGFPVNAFCAAINIGRTTFYALPPHLQPKTVKIGNRTIVTESPAEYLARIAAVQADEKAA